MRSTLTIPLVQHAPRFGIDEALSLAHELFNLRATAERLPSERDQNFLLTDTSDQKFVLKIANSLEDEALLLAQSEAMTCVGERYPFCQQLVPSVNGKILERFHSAAGTTNLIRLATFLPGVPLGESRNHSEELLNDLGHKVGQMDAVLMEVNRPAVHRNFHWDLANCRPVITEYAGLIREGSLRAAILQYESTFECSVAPLLAQLRQSCIHGDTNDYNILVNEDCSEVVGIIDFGDMVHSYTVGDLAIALAYVVLNHHSPVVAAANVVAGYREVLPLRQEEIDAVWGLMIMRLCMSVCIAAYQRQQQPDNEYLDISQQAIRESLPKLMAVDSLEVNCVLRNALS